MLFNRDMNNYSFELIFDSQDRRNGTECPDRIPSIIDIIDDNSDYLIPFLKDGHSLVFELIHFEGANPRIVSHFAVVRSNEKGELFLKR